MPLWYVVWMCKTYFLTKGHAGSRGWGGGVVCRGTHPKINYKTLMTDWQILRNEPIFLLKINSAGAVTLDLFVGIIKCLCGWQTCTSMLEKSCRLTTGSHLKVYLERLKTGWVVKKSVFSFLNALISTKLHSCSKLIYFAINIYYFQHPPHHLKILPPFWGDLGRISALVIEVL